MILRSRWWRSALALPLVALLATAIAAGDLVEVTVTGGSKIAGTLLRENEQGVVVDLGYEVLTIPKEQVLDVRRVAADGKAQDPTAATAHDIFSTGRLEPMPVPELVQRFGDAVVMVKTAAGLGSGFIISEDGHLITNYHVVEGETRVVVTLFRKTERGYEKVELKKVKILALQPLRDIALLELDLTEIPGHKFKPVVINNEDDLRVGDMVFAIGNPLGLERTVTQGIVSSTTRTIEHLRLIQTDSSINPGNSGGPLFNARGEVVGIACAGYTFFNGLAFGIPSEELVDFLRHRDSYLYDPAQPQNGITYLPPPFETTETKKEGS